MAEQKPPPPAPKTPPPKPPPPKPEPADRPDLGDHRDDDREVTEHPPS